MQSSLQNNKNNNLLWCLVKISSHQEAIDREEVEHRAQVVFSESHIISQKQKLRLVSDHPRFSFQLHFYSRHKIITCNKWLLAIHIVSSLDQNADSASCLAWEKIIHNFQIQKYIIQSLGDLSMWFLLQIKR